MKVRLRSSGFVVHQMRSPAVMIGCLSFLLAVPAASFAADADFASRVDRVLAETPLIDGHNDLPEQLRSRFTNNLSVIDLASDTSKLLSAEGGRPLMTDIPRLRAGRMGAQFWSVWVPSELKGNDAVQTTLEQI